MIRKGAPAKVINLSGMVSIAKALVGLIIPQGAECEAVRTPATYSVGLGLTTQGIAGLGASSIEKLGAASD